jgi:hypothetical protein
MGRMVCSARVIVMVLGIFLGAVGPSLVCAAEPAHAQPAPAFAPPSSRTSTPAAPPLPAANQRAARNWGEPLVDNLAEMKRLDPTAHLWLDPKRKEIVFLGEVCRPEYPLEYFATFPGREYESVVVVDAPPRTVHAGLLALGAKPGRPASFEPKYAPPSGTEVEIYVRWQDPQGRRREARAQDWVRHAKTHKPLEVNWVFAGSQLVQDPLTGRRVYLADDGDFISVANVPGATLDLPLQAPSALEARLFECATERMPPRGTPVTIILRPKLPKPP